MSKVAIATGVAILEAKRLSQTEGGTKMKGKETGEGKTSPIRKIKVNNSDVECDMHSPTPEDIKKFAIESGVEIDIGFELAAEDDDGQYIVMRESVEIDIERFTIFTATAPDDNA